MLRYDVEQFERVRDGHTAELRLSQVIPELIRHLNTAAEALENA
jgi:hypothetical protein